MFNTIASNKAYFPQCNLPTFPELYENPTLCLVKNTKLALVVYR